MSCEMILHDPYVSELNGHKVFKNVYETTTDCDAVVIVTRHSAYETIDWARILKSMRQRPAIIDGRNLLSREVAEKLGFLYQGVGKYRRAPARNK
jgi:UDPglucose 6-dehydrogenase